MNVATTKHDVLCVGFTPALQRTMEFDGITPGEVNRARSVTLSSAGKGVNVAAVLKSLASDPVLTGFIGGDGGRFIAKDLAEKGIPCEWVETQSATRNCHTLIDLETRETTELVEEAHPPSDQEWTDMNWKLEQIIPTCRFVAISGKLPPHAPVDTYARIVQKARESNTKCLVDSQKAPLREALQHEPFMVKMNSAELAMTCGCSISSDGDMVNAMRTIHDQGAEWVMVTQGPRAVWLLCEEHITLFTPPQVEAVNPIGSGDAVTAGILHTFAHGHSMQESVKFGVACGTANVLTPVPGLVAPDVAAELALQVKFESLI